MKIWIILVCMLVVACGSIAPRDAEGSEAGPVFISNADLLIMESFPVQVVLSISGELPTPCHRLFTNVEQPDKNNRIDITVESQAGSGEACIQVLEPFSTQLLIDMQGKSDGIYSTWLNGELVGEFSYPG